VPTAAKRIAIAIIKLTKENPRRQRILHVFGTIFAILIWEKALFIETTLPIFIAGAALTMAFPVTDFNRHKLLLGLRKNRIIQPMAISPTSCSSNHCIFPTC
jgi:hypothetical protein